MVLVVRPRQFYTRAFRFSRETLHLSKAQQNPLLIKTVSDQANLTFQITQSPNTLRLLENLKSDNIRQPTYSGSNVSIYLSTFQDAELALVDPRHHWLCQSLNAPALALDRTDGRGKKLGRRTEGAGRL